VHWPNLSGIFLAIMLKTSHPQGNNEHLSEIPNLDFLLSGSAGRRTFGGSSFLVLPKYTFPNAFMVASVERDRERERERESGTFLLRSNK
jgi:hypothetical protein